MKYDKKTYALLNEALLTVRKRQEGLNPERGGICLLVGDNLGHGVDAPRWLLHELFSEWPDYSGDHNYPVPAPHGTRATAESYYFGRRENGMGICALPLRHHWAKGTAYGDSRRALLDWLIERTEKAV